MQGLRQLHGRSEGGRIGVLSLNQEMVNAVPRLNDDDSIMGTRRLKMDSRLEAYI